MNILIVEDDLQVSSLLLRVLRDEGYSAEVERNGKAGLERALHGNFDLLVLDWMLPDLDGIGICTELRKQGSTLPILMLTARTETKDVVSGLDVGADDYVSKPFELDELLARVRALFRRKGHDTKIRYGELEMDRLEHTMNLHGVVTPLTSREYVLLSVLLAHAGEPVQKATLLLEVWDMKSDPGTNILEVHMSRLREKLGPHAWMVETVRGVGYRIRSERT